MSADLHLDPDGLRRAAVTARRIADGLSMADPGPSAAGTPAAGLHVEHLQERLRESVRRARDELVTLASEASMAAARADETDRAVAAALQATSLGGLRTTDPTAGRE